MGDQLYTEIWKKALPDILDLLEIFPYHGSKGLSSDDFLKAGDRKDYSFRLEISNGAVANNIDGSAPARDLADVFLSDMKGRAFSQGRKILLRLDRNFTIHSSLLG